MFAFLSDFFTKKEIQLFSPIRLSDCEIRKPYLLEREGIASGTAIMLAIPYFTAACLDPERNLSAYAVSKDYHGFFRNLFAELLPLLRERFPEYKFAGFADHSPIAELPAAAHAGLGVIGKNDLLLTEPYSSYVFLGELITDALLPSVSEPIRSCPDCGACKRACPKEKLGGCLSELTQKKQPLSDAEQENLIRYGSVWGCDLCQECCPYTIQAIQSGSIFTKIPYFSEDPIPRLTLETLDRMTDEEFSSRAYSWRGRETIRRNLELLRAQDAQIRTNAHRKGDLCSN